jgi:5-methylcytosine-specific restriction endonuclease McrA
VSGSFCTVCRRRIPKGSRCKRHAIRSPSNRAWHEPGALVVRHHVMERDGFACTRCGATENLEVHHVEPARLGGRTMPENLVVLCADCHRAAEAQ